MKQFHGEPVGNYERVEADGDVFYSIFSRYDGEILHLAPDQLQELQQWLAKNQDIIGSDIERKNVTGVA